MLYTKILPQLWFYDFFSKGIIPAENLKKILSQLPDTSEEEVDAMISAIDDDVTWVNPSSLAFIYALFWYKWMASGTGYSSL